MRSTAVFCVFYAHLSFSFFLSFYPFIFSSCHQSALKYSTKSTKFNWIYSHFSNLITHILLFWVQLCYNNNEQLRTNDEHFKLNHKSAILRCLNGEVPIYIEIDFWLANWFQLKEWYLHRDKWKCSGHFETIHFCKSSLKWFFSMLSSMICNNIWKCLNNLDEF